MSPYIILGLCSLIPVAASVLLYLADKKTGFAKLSCRTKQIIYGVVFGLIAVSGTEFGVKLGELTMNVRDAAPICAGLIFGAPAGIIAGLIGGVERWIAAAWGAGEYTKIACSVATLFAGCYAGWLRVYLFDNKKPAWYYGFATGVIAEALHITLLFITHADDPTKCFSIINAVAIPQIVFTGLSAMLAVLLIGILSRDGAGRAAEKVSIARTFQTRLLCCILIAFMITGVFTYEILNSASEIKVDTVMETSLNDLKDEIVEATNTSLLDTTRSVAKELNTLNKIDNGNLMGIASRYGLCEINVVMQDGIIHASSDSSCLNFDMRSGEQSAEFLELLYSGTNELVQEFQPRTQGADKLRKYAGVTLRNGGFVQVAYNSDDLREEIQTHASKFVGNRHVGEGGFLIVCNEKLRIVADREGLAGKGLAAAGIDFDIREVAEKTRFSAELYGEDYFCMYTVADGYYLIASIPQEEANFTRNSGVYFSVLMEALIFTALFIVVYFLIKHLVVDNISKVNTSLSRITGGDLNETVDVRTNEEFASLSDDINSTVTTLKHYIDEAEARIDKELGFAHTIQHSALPSVFPPYPNRSEFDIWAGMYAAKEVGGDFYDFYLLGEDRLVFLVADVSGKGIPAAMFMMTAKTLIKSLMESGKEVNEVFTEANAELCANNEAGMFITAWMGVINLTTGAVSYVNAGHNPPLIKRGNGEFEYLRGRTGFVLAGMEGMRYRKNELTLEPGDRLYLYTDGVTEATDANTVLYGEDRLLACLNSVADGDAESICRAIKSDVDEFVGSAPQFDDITMLCLHYNGPESNAKELTVRAKLENIGAITDFVDAKLEELGCPIKTVMRINIAVDEIFNNIASYAYGEGEGDATVRFEHADGCAIISFTDSGVAFDPLAKTDPDITLSAEERKIGGLGIFMVKKIMDDVRYERRNGMNILTVCKKI